MPSIQDICDYCDESNVPNALEALLAVLQCTFPMCIHEDIDDCTQQWTFKSGDSTIVVTQHMNEDRFSVYSDRESQENDERAMEAGYQYLALC